MSQWIKWDGGECPLPSGELVDVELRNGNFHHGIPAGSCFWGHLSPMSPRDTYDIVEYRIHDTSESKSDMVDHPSHYTQGGIECIDAIKSATVGKTGIEAVAVANVIKYLWRYEEKNGLEDIKKAAWYINHLIKQVEGGSK